MAVAIRITCDGRPCADSSDPAYYGHAGNHAGPWGDFEVTVDLKAHTFDVETVGLELPEGWTLEAVKESKRHPHGFRFLCPACAVGMSDYAKATLLERLRYHLAASTPVDVVFRDEDGALVGLTAFTVVGIEPRSDEVGPELVELRRTEPSPSTARDPRARDGVEVTGYIRLDGLEDVRPS